MMHRAERGLVTLDQGEARAWYFQRRMMGGGAQKGAAEGGFAGAQRTFQQDRVALPRARGNVAGQCLGGGEIVKDHRFHFVIVAQTREISQRALCVIGDPA